MQYIQCYSSGGPLNSELNLWTTQIFARQQPKAVVYR